MEGWKRGLDLDWAFDLVSPDPVRRASARNRHAETEAAHSAAAARINELWRRTGTLDPAEPNLAADMEQRISASQDAYQYLLSGAISEFVHFRRVAALPYALLFLEWEARFPNEWPRWWGTKKNTLRIFSQLAQFPPGVRARLAELVVQAVCRQHRCEEPGQLDSGRTRSQYWITQGIWVPFLDSPGAYQTLLSQVTVTWPSEPR
jgi:hypothetical protein